MPKNSKRHDSSMLAAWARQYGIKDKYYQEFDPKFKEQQRMKALREGQTKRKKK